MIVFPNQRNHFIESVLEEIVPILDSIFIKISVKEEESELNIPGIVKTRNGFHEDVSDLNGIAIPMMYFDYLMSNNIQKIEKIEKEDNTYIIEDGGKIIINIIESSMQDVKSNDHRFLKKVIENIPKKCNTISDYLYISNVYTAVKEKLYFKLNQIKEDEYIWLSDDVVKECFTRIESVIGDECYSNGKFTANIEETIINKSDEKIHQPIDDFLCNFFPNELFRFTARTDVITEDSVWEIKCTSSIVNDHLLQVVIYAWLWRMSIENVPELENIKCFKIFNIKTGEIYILNAFTSELNTIMVALLKGKYGIKESKIDKDFIKECKSHIAGKDVYV